MTNHLLCNIFLVLVTMQHANAYISACWSNRIILLKPFSSVHVGPPADTLVEPDVNVSLVLVNSFHLLHHIHPLCKGPGNLSEVSSVRVA